jgi:hypothetical protein
MLPTKKCHLSDETETIIKDWTKFKNANEHALSHHDHSYQHCKLFFYLCTVYHITLSRGSNIIYGPTKILT